MSEIKIPFKGSEMQISEKLPKSKIVIGESAVFSKEDSLFGTCFAYEIKSEKDLEVLRNLIYKLQQIFM